MAARDASPSFLCSATTTKSSHHQIICLDFIKKHRIICLDFIKKRQIICLENINFVPLHAENE